MIFAFFYYLFAVLLHILFLPYLWYLSTKSKYKDAVPDRFMLSNRPFSSSGLWFHGCSLGEIVAIQPIVKEFEGTVDINISTITDTGYGKAKELYRDSRFLPFETLLPFWIIKQKALIVVEAELWYMLFFVASLRKIPTILINARISDKSYAKYLRHRWFYKKIFANIDKIFAQSDIDQERLQMLGATNIEVTGNIKLSSKPKVTTIYKKPANIFLIVAASTHETEEQLILDSWNKDTGRLIIVPRHPQRFDKVDKLIQNHIANTDITYSKFSKNKTFDTDISLVDCLGELVNIYAISDAVILGGAFAKVGGHNPVEPAYFHNILITGKYIFNQLSLFEFVDGYEIVQHDKLKESMKNIKRYKRTTLLNPGDNKAIIEQIKETIDE